jgi:hypothetical protein
VTARYTVDLVPSNPTCDIAYSACHS